METVEKLFETFGGPTALARALDVGTSTASEMKRRKSIPVEYWPRIVSEAGSRGYEGISYETLVAMHAGKRARAAA